MLQSITVTNHTGSSFELSLFYPEHAGVIIADIDGIGPSDATINTTEYAAVDGAFFNSAHIQKRNITMKLRPMYSPTIEHSRHKIYAMFPVKKRIKLKFTTDIRVLETEGYVESCEPDIFSKEEEISISIICPDPFFYATDRSVVQFSGIIPAFEFPFSNESSDPITELGQIDLETTKAVYYDGDADVGFDMTIKLSGAVGDITIYHEGQNKAFVIDSAKVTAILDGVALKAGDEIHIVTISGKKNAYVLRNGERTNIFNAIGRNADWIQLNIGDNLFTYSAVTGTDHMQIDISYNTAFGGV